MTATELLAHLQSQGIEVAVDGQHLRLRAARGQLTDELKAVIAAQKLDLIQLLTGRGAATPVEGEFPASFAQRRLWFLDRLEPDSRAYHLGASRLIEAAVDPALMERAINDVVERQGALRTVFREVDGEPSQVVKPFEPVSLAFIDLSQQPTDSRAAQAREQARLEAMRAFDLARGPLFRATLVRLGDEQHMLLLSLHHIICDGWSLGVLADDLRQCYEARLAGRAPALGALSVHYGEYAASEQTRLAGQSLERLAGYWRQRLAGAPPILELPADRPRPPQRTFNGAVIEFALSAEVSQALRELAQQERATLYMTLLALFNVLLYRHSGQSDIVVGTPVANRLSPEWERLVGMFVSTLPIRTQLKADTSVRSLIAQVRQHVLEAQEHQDLPFEKLVDELRPERSMAWSPIFQVVFAPQNAERGGGLQVTSVAAMYDLSLYQWVDAGTIRFGFEYNTDLYDAATIERLGNHFVRLAESAVADPELAIGRLPMLSQAERTQLIDGWNDSAREYPRESNLHALFDSVVRERPDAIAIESGDAAREVLPVPRLSYRELAAAADRLAARLQAAGVQPGMSVALVLERSLSAVLGLLAIIRCGAAYVPLDPGDPEQRSRDVLSDAGVRVALTRRGLVGRLASAGIETALAIEDAWRESSAAGGAPAAFPATPADAPAYVMFTSGTTGRPKGVCVTHRNIVRLVRQQNYMDLGADEVLLQFAPLAFDAATYEIWGALLNGARLVVHPSGVPTTRELADALHAHRITALFLTTGFFHSMVENQLEALAGVRQVLCGGDVLSPTHVQRLLDAKRGGVVVPVYGPTENTTYTTYHRMEPGQRVGDTVPIGRPIANTRVYLLDAHGEPVPIGVAGELYAGGDGVARGYLGDTAASAQKFLPDPFAARAGATMYRTGDLARWRADGCIEFIGRRDRQVKVRGFRIELEEIEDALRACAQIRDAAVLARRDATGTQVLAAYLVPNAGASLDVASVKHALAERLPAYMIPQAFVTLDALPLTANGKLDRTALPEPGAAVVGGAQAEPRTTLEAQLHATWERVLGRTGIGIHDNFFDLGGHSLLAVRLFAQIERLLRVQLPISALFLAPTIAQLAQRIEHDGFKSPWSSLVPIQPDGARPPLFLVPGVGGNVVCFNELARQLGREQPVYGLQSRGLDNREAVFERIEPMAAHYIREIREVQPRGPYFIGGACFGGVVAYEMAQQLRAAGEQVAFLALLESWPVGRRMPVLDTLLLRSHALRFAVSATKRNLAAIARLPPRQMFAGLMQRLKVFGEIAAQRDVYRGDRASMYLDRVSTSNVAALLHYRPRPYDGELLHVRASLRAFRGRDYRELWRELARGGCREVDIEVPDSGTLLLHPHVELLAQWMQAALSGKPYRFANPAPAPLDTTVGTPAL